MYNQVPFGFPNQMPNQNMFMPDFNSNNNSNCPCQQLSEIEQKIKTLETKVKNIENRLNISNNNDYQYQSSMYMM